MSDLTSKEISNLANAVGNPHGLSYDEEQRIKRALTDYAALLERPQEAREPLTPLQKERNYKTHKTRMSDASSFDEICTECGATDFPGSDLLDLPCPKAVPPHEPLAHSVRISLQLGDWVQEQYITTRVLLNGDLSVRGMIGSVAEQLCTGPFIDAIHRSAQTKADRP